jgi:hypothetical protein
MIGVPKIFLRPQKYKFDSAARKLPVRQRKFIEIQEINYRDISFERAEV